MESAQHYRVAGKEPQHLMEWKGYADEERTWEPSSNLTNCQEAAVRDFAQQNPQIPVPGEFVEPGKLRPALDPVAAESD